MGRQLLVRDIDFSACKHFIASAESPSVTAAFEIVNVFARASGCSREEHVTESFSPRNFTINFMVSEHLSCM